MTGWADVRRDPIVIEPYDASWAESFEAQKAVLERVLASWLAAPVEHIGSTSVPGLPAKPIIDMVAVVDDYNSFEPALARLDEVEWQHAPEPGDADQRKWSVCYPTVAHRTHHLHVVEQSSPGWPDWLLFRDYLRTHPQASERYAELKRQLAAADRSDRVRYRSGKAPLIAELMEEAEHWHRVGRG